MFICCYWFFISDNSLETYAYYLDDNGNIQSSNLWSLNSSYSISSDGYIVYNNELLLSSGTYTFTFDFTGSSAVADFRLYTLYEDQPIYDKVFTIVNGINSFTFTLNSNTTKILWYSNATGSYTNLMLNSGSSAIVYEPYGKVWYSSQGNYSPLFKVLNGTTARAYNSNITDLQTLLNTTPTMTEVVNWSSSYGWSSGSISNIQHAILDASQGDPFFRVNRPIILLSLNTPLVVDNLTFYRIDNNQIRYIYLYFFDGSMESVSIADSSDVSTKYVNWYNYNNKALSYIAFDCEPGYDMVTDISQPSYSMVYADGYDAGSSDGYKEGYQMGLKDGSNGGYQLGYDRGKQDGIQIGSNQSNTLYGMVIAVVDAPINIFKSIFNFDILGINIVGIVFGIITLLLIIYLIKKLL